MTYSCDIESHFNTNTHQANAGFFSKISTSILSGYIVNKLPDFIYNVPTGYLVRYIVNEIRVFIHMLNVAVLVTVGIFL